MRSDLDEALCRDFPLLYRERNLPKSRHPLAFGFEIGDGWEPLVRRLSEKLEPIARTTSPHFRCVQLKQKFETLRWYHAGCSDADYSVVRAALEEAEQEALRTCEECGEPADSAPYTGYYAILCPLHRAERKKLRGA